MEAFVFRQARPVLRRQRERWIRCRWSRDASSHTLAMFVNRYSANPGTPSTSIWSMRASLKLQLAKASSSSSLVAMFLVNRVFDRSLVDERFFEKFHVCAQFGGARRLQAARIGGRP